jgi:hypothetical protein
VREALHPVLAVRHRGLQSHQGEVRQIRQDVRQTQDALPDRQGHRDHPSLQSQDGSDAWDEDRREIAPERPAPGTDSDTHLGHPEAAA